MSLNDSVILSGDVGFQGRVLAAFLAECRIISSEGDIVPLHNRRLPFAITVANNPAAFREAFAWAVACDPAVVYAATYGAPVVVLTPANVAAQAASIEDSIINTAVSGTQAAGYLDGAFNTFLLHA